MRRDTSYFKMGIITQWSCVLSVAIAMEFNIVQYNIFGRPYEVSSDGQAERLWRIPAAINSICSDKQCGGVDIVTFAEADIESEREGMIAEFKKEGFQYATSILQDHDPFTSLLNGGVLIVSKWPIVREGQHIYRHACHYSDCLAAKGVKYARAWSTAEGRSDRVKQASQMRTLIDAFRIPHTEPLVFAGDFNTDNVSFPREVQGLVKILRAHVPTRIGNQKYTSNPHSNLLVGRDGAATSNKCASQYVRSWGAVTNNTYHPNGLTRVKCGKASVNMSMIPVFIQPQSMCYCPCCPSEWLDYVLWGQAPYQQPSSQPSIEAVALKVKPFTVAWTAPTRHMSLDLVDLSDHYPVLGRFQFPVTGDTIQLDGCSNDNDCHFHEFSCYCSGPNCFYKGKHVNGRALPTDHPVNRNCIYGKTSAECFCGPT